MKNKLFKIFGYGIAILIPIILAVTVYLYVNKGDITKKLLLDINSYTNGELQIGEVEINPFVHFPNISLTLNEPRYFEKKLDETDSTNNQIFHFSKLHVSFDILELFNSRIKIIAISAEEGSVNIIQNLDSTFNITTAFQVADASEPSIADDSTLTDTINGSPDFALSIKKLSLKKVSVVIDLTPT